MTATGPGGPTVTMIAPGEEPHAGLPGRIVFTSARASRSAKDHRSAPHYRWKGKYGGVELSEMQRLKQLELLQLPGPYCGGAA